jgi:mediator of RNA polymerase II transcription subunit 23
MNLEEKIATFIDDILKVEAIEESFNLYIVHRPDLEKAKIEQRTEDWFAVLGECSAAANTANENNSSQVDQALKCFVTSASNPLRGHKFATRIGHNDVLMQLLELAVEKRVVGARQVCDALFMSENLRPDRCDFWLATFSLVRKIIGGVDYKGVREIMKICVDKVTAMPNSSTLEQQVNVVRELLVYIFDRNAALLPGIDLYINLSFGLCTVCAVSISS